ncbi:hypothetical protein [Rhodoplanes sp. Z2-YC6860]|uniref:hypothetical protein n=1 Tax=Rhodoplanes sp. Z2-YC6860 TaxID=674703 RepID=UPI00078C92CF|nr:hypothetical protein [Rhodoplanes sp. Z2-YC6860]AMN44092.1 hypothetical protein RHPLAN_56770 [Rhodoplanes sp. Z2-YC6860]
MVLGDFGRLTRAWREMDDEQTSEHDVVQAIISGEYTRPVKVVAFDLDERWAGDVTENIARAVVTTAIEEGLTLGRTASEFVTRVTGEDLPADLIEA